MDYQTFIEIIKLYEQHPRLIALPQPFRSALQGLPEEFGQLLHSIMPVMRAQLNRICPNRNARVGIFGLQPAALMTASPQPDKNELWYTLDFDVLEPSTTGQTAIRVNSGAILINFSTGLIVNGAYYVNLVEPSLNLPNAVCYSQIPVALLQQAWSAIYRKAQFENLAGANANLCRNYAFPMLAPLSKSFSKVSTLTPPTPSFWQKSCESVFMNSALQPSSQQKSDLTIPSQPPQSLRPYGRHSV